MAAPFVMWCHHFILAFLVIPNPKGDEVPDGFLGQGSVLAPSVCRSLLTVDALVSLSS